MVAEAIWSISSEHRLAHQIWMKPTDHEREQMAGAIHQFRAEDAKRGYHCHPDQPPIIPKACSYVEPEPTKEEKKDERKPRAPRKRSRTAAAPNKRAAKGRS